MQLLFSLESPKLFEEFILAATHIAKSDFPHHFPQLVQAIALQLDSLTADLHPNPSAAAFIKHERVIRVLKNVVKVWAVIRSPAYRKPQHDFVISVFSKLFFLWEHLTQIWLHNTKNNKVCQLSKDLDRIMASSLFCSNVKTDLANLAQLFQYLLNKATLLIK